MSANSSFEGDIFLAAAAAIPVLWIAIGFASNAMAAVFRSMKRIQATVDLQAPGVRYLIEPDRISLSAFGVQMSVLGPGTRDVVAFTFILLVVVSGAMGEVVSFWALLSRDPHAWLGWSVFVAACVLVLLTVVVIIISLATAAAEARAPNIPAATDVPIEERIARLEDDLEQLRAAQAASNVLPPGADEADEAGHH